jgi:dTDP-4-dehydrorhamnose 3,5-epimerase
MTISLDEFVDDRPWVDSARPLEDVSIPDQIDGVRLRRLVTSSDNRGDLTVLFSSRLIDDPLPPHIYWVTAAPGSVRAWVFHRRQSDRLAFTNGQLRVVLYDARPGSPTNGKLNIVDVGADNKVQLTIPPFVIHGVHNRGATEATFVNMPTNAYDPATPDKARVRSDHPGIPYRFE